MFYLGNLLLGDNRSNSERNEEDDDDDDDDINNDDGGREEEEKESTVGSRTDNTSFDSSLESVPLTPPILLSPFRFRSRPNATVIPVIPQPAKIHVPATSISLPPSTFTPGSVPVPLIINREEGEQSTPSSTSHVPNNVNLNVIPNLDQNPESDSQQPAALRRRFPPKPRIFSHTGESASQQILRCHTFSFDINLTDFMSNFRIFISFTIICYCVYFTMCCSIFYCIFL